jgi:hypothetical protein
METVHAVWDFYDSPRTGFADYCGQPHYFSCQWDIATDDYSRTYALSPIDSGTLDLVMKQWAIWRKWEFAFHAGEVLSDSHPGLSGHDPRYDELQLLLQSRVDALPASNTLAYAKFHPVATGDFQLASCGRSLSSGRMPPNNSFKPNPLRGSA